jgi:hypothetical protein
MPAERMAAQLPNRKWVMERAGYVVSRCETATPVLAPVLIFVAGLLVGAVGGFRFLPSRADGPVARLALGVTCGLVGVALALVGVEIYETIRNINRVNAQFGGVSKADVLASGLINMLRDVGPILGLAAVAYLLAPGERDADIPRA